MTYMVQYVPFIFASRWNRLFMPYYFQLGFSGPLRRQFQSIFNRALRPIQGQTSPVKPVKDTEVRWPITALCSWVVFQITTKIIHLFWKLKGILDPYLEKIFKNLLRIACTCIGMKILRFCIFYSILLACDFLLWARFRCKNAPVGNLLK
jgi:hypothetical protein